ncbi:MAG: UDP-N-acetylmuramoyl-L-alanine--D-glutamate ligase [Planctomycetes bacterium]|nr:UDP-N-acetylmuramoyl-L-alanine--D-glutamate ligase [Planctomycetota bacterium]
MESLTGKKVLIMGLGRFGGGVDVAEFAVNNGAIVTVTDLAAQDQLAESIKQLKDFPQIEYHLGSHSLADFEQADIIVANPAVTPDNEFIKIAKQHNKLITSQINIFLELCPATTIGITGANGKSTTAALTAHLLRAGLTQKDFKYSNVWLSGNIGNEPLLTSLDKITADDLVVLELSSFQLEQLVQIKKSPKVALLTNLTPNHLDRHGTFENYCVAKENIFKLQKLDANCPAVSIFCAEDEISIEWFEKYKQDKGRTCLKFSPDDVTKEICDNFSLPGRANLSNLAAAATIAKYFGIGDEQIKNSLPEFKPLPHRLELVARIDSIAWYNDSIATTPQSTIAAIEAFEQPKIIIAGGYDKNLPFDQLGEKIARNAKAAILIGQTAEKIAEAIKKCPENQTKIEFADSLAEAVHSAIQIATKGDVVLLSPACASYDMFDNFQHRGQEFIRLVQKINT